MSSTYFSVVMNGKCGRIFKAFKGLRRGDPLSPFLFILVANVLSRLVDRAKECDLFEGLVIGKDSISMSHLQFADVTLFFAFGMNKTFPHCYLSLRFLSWCLG